METRTINKQLKMGYGEGIGVRPKEHLALWKQVKGLWSKRQPNPASELSVIRREWQRAYPRH